MAHFIATALLSFAIMSAAAFYLNFRKSRPRSGSHLLTGMCHCSGGPASCGLEETKGDCRGKQGQILSLNQAPQGRQTHDRRNS